MLSEINSIAEKQTHPTQNFKAAITYFFDYSANNTNATVKFRASDMIIHIDSDTHNSQNHDYAAVL